MTDELVLDRNADERYGEAVELSPLVRRVLAPNPGPFTFKGTNTYLLGHGHVAVIDPGPDNPQHVAAVLAAVAAGGERITRIITTHTHHDHVGALPALAAATGAPVIGAAPPQRPSDDDLARYGMQTWHGAAPGYEPDHILDDGEILAGDGWTLEAIATPGHAANHLAYALKEDTTLFSGDHVMAWSTSTVTPPSGSMAAYMASMRRLLERPEDVYYSGHGPLLREARTYARRLLAHREKREHDILSRLRAGDRTVPEIMRAAYVGLDPRLERAASLVVVSHLEHLIARGAVRSDGPVTIAGAFAAV